MENNTIPPLYPAELVEQLLVARTDCPNHTLTDEEMEIIQRIADDMKRKWSE